MRSFRVSENIVPVSGFKTRAAEMLRRLAQSGETLVITQNGKAAGVLMSPQAYDELTERAHFMAAVLEGLEDVRTGRLIPHERVRKSLARARAGGKE
jgi:prevent-host-death family protein